MNTLWEVETILLPFIKLCASFNMDVKENITIKEN